MTESSLVAWEHCEEQRSVSGGAYKNTAQHFVPDVSIQELLALPNTVGTDMNPGTDFLGLERFWWGDA